METVYAVGSWCLGETGGKPAMCSWHMYSVCV